VPAWGIEQVRNLEASTERRMMRLDQVAAGRATLNRRVSNSTTTWPSVGMQLSASNSSGTMALSLASQSFEGLCLSDQARHVVCIGDPDRSLGVLVVAASGCFVDATDEQPGLAVGQLLMSSTGDSGSTSRVGPAT
jgi:hypothetical protein